MNRMSIDTALPVVTADAFRNVMGHFATGVTVITTVDEGRPLGTTANAISSLCLEPPMLVVCLNRESVTGRAIDRVGSFGVTILASEQGELARRFATKDDDKFAGVEVVRGAGGQPLLAGALAHLEGEVVEAVAAGTHTVFLARVVSAQGHAGAPLAYYRGRFADLDLDLAGAERVGTPDG
jgi:flavin reductase (DIM6/NTAB) family NADH-FMN oxidoreductase RutF